MANVKFYLDRRPLKTLSKHRLYLVFRYHNKKFSYYPPLSIAPQDWDDQAARAKKTCADAKRINTILDVLENWADWKVDRSRTVVQDCQFKENEARFGGGAYLYLYKDQVCVLDGCTFESNGALSENSLGGGLLLASGDRIVEDARITEVGNTNEFRVTNCLVLANSSSFLGGGISLARGSFQLINSTIALNEVSNLGGGVYFDGSKGVKLVNCTIARNESKNRGGGIVAGNDPSTANTHFEMYNSIIANNTVLNNNSRELTVQNNCNLNFLNNANAEQNIEWPAPLNPNNRNDLLCARVSSEVLIADPRLGELADNGGKVATSK